jgi:hypothetical protein
VPGSCQDVGHADCQCGTRGTLPEPVLESVGTINSVDAGLTAACDMHLPGLLPGGHRRRCRRISGRRTARHAQHAQRARHAHVASAAGAGAAPPSRRARGAVQGGGCDPGGARALCAVLGAGSLRDPSMHFHVFSLSMSLWPPVAAPVAKLARSQQPRHKCECLPLVEVPARLLALQATTSSPAS